MRLSLGLSGAAFVLALAAPAAARGPYVTLRDDGTLAKKTITTNADVEAVQAKVLALYDQTGTPRPEVLSVWTTFPTNGNIYETLFVPDHNDVTGIGLEGMAPNKSPVPPLRCMLLHNDATKLKERAARQGASADGFGEYLFLLELSHLWGPALLVPSNGDAGTPEDELTGFPFHWSFWMDAGGSPAGGNRWKDNGDGTFTAQTEDPKTIRYSMLDLYAMGLADPTEVMPFGVLENAVPPVGMKDPLWGGDYAARSFPWFSAGAMTVKAQRRALTIDDVIGRNGKRSPARGASPSKWTLGIALVVSQNATADAVAGFEAGFDPVASALAPRFHDATASRGTLEVLTVAPAADAGSDAAPDPAPAGDAGSPPAVTPAPKASSGCSTTGSRGAGAAWLVVAALAARLFRRRAARSMTM